MWKIYHPSIPECINKVAKAPAMQRLQDVGMHCGCEYTSFPMFVGLKKYSRYDHSVGCALIVWHFTEDVRQTIAALLHDIATPTFAHVIDFLNGDHIKQESTERGTMDIIRQDGEIMTALEELGLRLEDVADYHQYPVADNDSPKLSADRLEYTMSNLIHYHIADEASVKAWYGDLVVGKNEEGADELMFQHFDAAEGFALAALHTSYIYIANEDRFAMQTLAELLKRHISRGVLSKEDLYQTENQAITLLNKDAEAKRDWEQYQTMQHIYPNSCHPEAKVIRSKKRYINPYLQGEGRVALLSSTFTQQLSQFLHQPLDAPLWGE
ncbi:MAG: hypothetical protein J5616_05940 [Bacteroidaceae bacterium]|nr:hypothetical protein [Bacteroidaceae bacterium]